MQEYYNFEYENINIKHPIYPNDDISILTPVDKKEKISLRTHAILCHNIKIWKKNNIITKCLFIFNKEELNWRLKNTLENISKKCKEIIAQKGKKWFSSIFSVSDLEKKYKKIIKKTQKLI